MSDFDTRRVSEIARLEETIRHLQDQIKTARVLADKWEPKVSSETESGTGISRLILQFGGNTTSVKMTTEWLKNMDTTSVTTTALNSMFETLVRDKLRDVLQPEAEKLIKNAVSTSKAGTW